jgi:preprotein translocase subunit YajC
MWTDALAQTGTSGNAPADPKIALLLQLLQFLPLFIILYLLLIRPQQQQKKKLNEMLKGLKKGDRVLTTGGIFGTVIGVDDAKAVLKIAEDVKVEFSKSAIVQVMAVEAK